jgi:hypothetical protein
MKVDRAWMVKLSWVCFVLNVVGAVVFTVFHDKIRFVISLLGVLLWGVGLLMFSKTIEEK